MQLTVFFDPSCPRPYDTRTLQNEAMGGAESTLVRIADRIDALVVQHNRTEMRGRYIPPQPLSAVQRVVVSRDPRAVVTAHRLYPNARLFLWLHDRMRPGSRRARRFESTADLLRGTATQIVCVSEVQRRDVTSILRSNGLHDHVQTSTIYNAIDESLVPDDTPVDLDTLVFFSSPNKGLKFALDAFRAMRARIPALRLLVANPGYKPNDPIAIDGVRDLGSQPPHLIHAHVRRALATFAPNWRIPETFGLVFAESLAVGTPVLTHDCGAAREIVGDPLQVLPIPVAARAYERVFGPLSSAWRRLPAGVAAKLGLFDAYIERIESWRSGGRPTVQPDPRFRIDRIAGQWRDLLR